MAGAIKTVRIRVAVVRVGIDGIMEAVGETGEGFEIDIGVIRPISSVLFADLVYDILNQFLNLIDQSVCRTAAVGSCTNIIGEARCALVGNFLQVFKRILRLNDR